MFPKEPRKIRGKTRASSYTVIDDPLGYPEEKMCTLPREWLLKIVRTMGKGSSDRIFLTWYMKAFRNPRFTTSDAADFCGMYLDSVDRKMWPTLLGVSHVMDEILGRRFKKK